MKEIILVFIAWILACIGLEVEQIRKDLDLLAAPPVEKKTELVFTF